MKNLIVFIVSLFISVSAIPQSGFNTEEFLNYRDNIKNMTLSELLDKYPPRSVYYSNRENPTDINLFQYLDSIDLRYNLTSDEKEMISENHFVVTERLSRWSFADAVVDIYSSDLPFFLSTDLVLHALHTSYDRMLQMLEYELLEGHLEILISSMRDEIDNLFSENSSLPEIQQSIKDADLFLATGLSLLKEETINPKYDDSGNFSKLMEEFAKEAPKMLTISLFSDHTRNFDASQFIPRGHYTEEFWTPEGKKDLKAYFRAMMWFGRADFFLTPPPVAPGEAPWSEEDIKRMNTSAMIVNELLERSGKKALLELHEKIIGFFVGPDDNLSPLELNKIITGLGYNYTDIQNETNYSEFQEMIKSSDDYGQKILSNFFYVDADKENPAELPISYRLLGQKFLIDSYIFSQVVYDNIYHNGKEVHRMLPDPLDIMFVLGNEDALPLLDEELKSYNYAYKLEELRYLTEAYDEDFWSQSLYNNWLNAIRALNPPEDKSNYPYFMKTTEWQVQKLNTQLASWTELRHDNVLYAKQSYTGGTSCSFPHVFIEPYPEFFGILNQFSESAANFFESELESINLDMKQGLIDYYTKFGEHMLKLKTLTEKELRKESFNENDIIYLKTFVNDVMASGPMITGWFMDLFYDKMKGMEADFLVVDVHTQPTEPDGTPVGRIMHVGTGYVDFGIFCTGSPCGDFKPTAFVGPVMSFHRKDTINYTRLTDEQWGEYFSWSGKGADRPDWAYHYLLDKKGRKVNPSVPGIPGILYMGNGIDEFQDTHNIAYLLAFPNPASGNASLRFILNKPADLNLKVFDILGKQVYSKSIPYLNAGEQNLVLNLSNFNQGLYYVKMEAAGSSKVTRLVVK